MHIRAPALVAGFLALTLAAAHALGVAPPILVLDERTGYAGEMRVLNPDTEPMAVEVSVFLRTFDEGGETETPADTDFVVFPPQAVIDPQSDQAIRFQYVGDALDGRSKSYRVYITEVLAPLSEDAAEQSTVRFQSRYGASLHLVPRGARAEPRVASAEPAMKQDGAPALRVRIENEGGRYVYLNETVISAGDFVFPMGDVMATQNAGLPIGPSMGRTITLPLPEGASPDAPVEIALREG